jgi:hypothetical protein
VILIPIIFFWGGSRKHTARALKGGDVGYREVKVEVAAKDKIWTSLDCEPAFYATVSQQWERSSPGYVYVCFNPVSIEGFTGKRVVKKPLAMLIDSGELDDMDMLRIADLCCEDICYVRLDGKHISVRPGTRGNIGLDYWRPETEIMGELGVVGEEVVGEEELDEIEALGPMIERFRAYVVHEYPQTNTSSTNKTSSNARKIMREFVPVWRMIKEYVAEEYNSELKESNFLDLIGWKDEDELKRRGRGLWGDAAASTRERHRPRTLDNIIWYFNQ